MELSEEFQKVTGEESHIVIREMYRPKAKYIQWLEYNVLRLRKELEKACNKKLNPKQAKGCTNPKLCLSFAYKQCGKWCKKFPPEG